MEMFEFIKGLVGQGVLGAANIIALVAIGLLYRLLINRDRIIEKMAATIMTHTTVLTEVKTVLEVLLRGGSK